MPEFERSEASGALDARIALEQTRLLFSALPGVLALTLPVTVFLVITFWSSRPPAVLLGWFALYLLVACARLLLWWRFGRVQPGQAEAERWTRHFCLLSLASGIVWGLTPVLMFDGSSPYQQALVAFLIAGLAAGGVVNLAARWQCSWMFLLPTLLPFVGWYLASDTPYSDSVAVLVGLLAFAMMVLTVQGAGQTRARLEAMIDLERRGDQARLQQARVQSLLESTRAIIWESEIEQIRFTYVSREAEVLLGYPVERWLNDETFWVDHMHPNDREWVPTYCARQHEAVNHYSFDYRMLAADGGVVWLRDVVNVIDGEHGRRRLVGVMFDISELKQAEAERAYIADLQQLIVRFARDLVEADLDDFTPIFDPMLEQLGRLCDTDRAYMIKFDRALERFTNTHEWTAEGISSEIDNMQDEPTDLIPNIVEALCEKRPVLIADDDALGPDWGTERELLTVQHIRSLICLPVFCEQRLYGLIGFDSVRDKRTWSRQEQAVLQVLGDLIGAVIERRAKARALEESEKLRSHAETLAAMGSWEWDEHGDKFNASAEWSAVTGLGAKQLSRERVLALTPPEDRDQVTGALDATLETGKPYEVEHRIVRADNGERRWVRVRAELDERPDGRRRLRGFMQDITERKQADDKLFEMAHFDSLTGLPNRVLLLDRLQHALALAARRNSTVALLFLDLDQFKRVNDTLGHEAGDRLLVEAGSRLTGLLRSDDTVARLGGDEFVVVLEDADESAILRVSRKVLDAFRSPIEVGGREFLLTASVGIAVGPADGNTASDLLRNADTAMYHAKQGGRDRCQFFTPAMNRAIERHLVLEQALRGAIERGELEVHYQPVFECPSRRCVAAEALLRWQHPDLGEITPDEFIDVAEQSGMIDDLGRFVVERVTARLIEWRRALAPDLVVSLNVSPRQFRDGAIAGFLTEALERAGLPGAALEVEITEGVLLSGRGEVRDALQALREHSVGIVMDDFGTGYASLSYLRDYPFTALKIDRSFICGLDSDPRHRQLVVSAIRLGRALNMKVVAEGVETESQLEILLAEGCTLIQGFLLGRPVDGDSLERLLGTRRPG